MRRAIADPRFLPIRDRLISLAEPLNRHLDLSTGILNALQNGIVPVSPETRKEVFGELHAATKTLEAALAKEPDAATWHEIFDLRRLSNEMSDMNTPTEDLRKHLDQILRAMADRDGFSTDQLRTLRSDVFWEFQKSAAKIQAILAWEKTPPTKKTLRETLRQLAFSFESLDRKQLITHAQDLQLAWDRLVLMNPKNAAEFAFLEGQYFADNLHVFASEEFMGRMVHDKRTDAGQISDTIMGAQVYGNQVTDTEATLDLIPSPQEALMAVKLFGNTNANTVGENCHIKVYVLGNSQFWAVKRTHFNGFRFRPEPAEIAVRANSSPYRAKTPISCFPLLGSCLDNFILNQAIARKPDGEAIARQKVADAVVPELNTGINEALDKANDQLENDVYARLSKKNLYPASMHTATTDTHLLTRGQIRNAAELGGSPAPTVFDEPTGANFHVHESLLNNVIDRINLAGRTMTEPEVREEVSKFILELTGQTVDLKAKPEKVQTDSVASDRFVFDKTTPLRFQVRNNQIQVTLRTALIRANGDEIPAHDIMVPLQFKVSGEEILFTKGQPAAQRVGMAGGVIENGIMADKVSQAIEDGHFTRRRTLQLQEGKTMILKTERIKAINGWLSIWALPVEPAPE